MILNPPAGSRISIGQDGGDPVILIPATRDAKANFLRVFLLCWLGGWAIAEAITFSQIAAGGLTGFALWMVYFWLCGWTLGGALAGYAAVRVWRPLVPETLCLRPSCVVYDSGIQPPQFAANSIREVRYFPKRFRLEIDPVQMRTLCIRKTGGGKRLTVDVGSRRIEIAPCASGVEAQWLARLLASRYGLPEVTSRIL